MKMTITPIYNVFNIQARDVRTNEVVAIKKMSYSGKQSTEVCWLPLTYIMLTGNCHHFKHDHVVSFVVIVLNYHCFHRNGKT